jgi:hypothetical protein
VVTSCTTRFDIKQERQGTCNVMKPLLPWKSNKYYIFLCVCAGGGGARAGAYSYAHINFAYPALGKPRRRWEDNIKMDLREVGSGAQTGLIWLRIGTNSWLLCIR